MARNKPNFSTLFYSLKFDIVDLTLVALAWQNLARCCAAAIHFILVMLPTVAHLPLPDSSELIQNFN
jgi:hypothetical protein